MKRLLILAAAVIVGFVVVAESIGIDLLSWGLDTYRARGAQPVHRMEVLESSVVIDGVAYGGSIQDAVLRHFGGIAVEDRGALMVTGSATAIEGRMPEVTDALHAAGITDIGVVSQPGVR